MYMSKSCATFQNSHPLLPNHEMSAWAIHTSHHHQTYSSQFTIIFIRNWIPSFRPIAMLYLQQKTSSTIPQIHHYSILNSYAEVLLIQPSCKLRSIKHLWVWKWMWIGERHNHLWYIWKQLCCSYLSCWKLMVRWQIFCSAQWWVTPTELSFNLRSLKWHSLQRNS